MLAAIVLGVMLSTCSSPPSVLERILRSGELRVVTRNTPAAFYYGADEPRGVEYELARGYAQKLGVSLRIYIDDQVFPDLVSGKAEIGAASLTIADVRRDSVSFGPGWNGSGLLEPLEARRQGGDLGPDCSDFHAVVWLREDGRAERERGSNEGRD